MKFLSILKKLCSLPYIYFSLWKDVRKQKSYLDNFIPELLKKIDLKSDGTLDAEDLKKINSYYGLGVPAILGESFCTLRGYKMTNDERECSTLSGSLTGLFDDLFDKNKTDNKLIEQLLYTPDSFIPINDNQKLSLEIYKLFLNKLVNKDLSRKFINEIFKVQLDSIKQERISITNEEIIDITYRKGGYSVLFFRSVYQHNLDKVEYDAFYQLGALMQLGNDIFDVYKDYKSSINTLVTRTEDIKVLRNHFIKEHIKTNNLLINLNYPSRNKAIFLNKVNLALSRCYVCLDQFERLQNNSNNEFKISDYIRKDLICDMEKPLNILKSLMYYINNNKLI